MTGGIGPLTHARSALHALSSAWQEVAAASTAVTAHGRDELRLALGAGGKATERVAAAQSVLPDVRALEGALLGANAARHDTLRALDALNRRATSETAPIVESVLGQVHDDIATPNRLGGRPFGRTVSAESIAEDMGRRIDNVERNPTRPETWDATDNPFPQFDRPQVPLGNPRHLSSALTDIGVDAGRRSARMSALADALAGVELRPIEPPLTGEQRKRALLGLSSPVDIAGERGSFKIHLSFGTHR